jgi:phage tail sheath protein FI
LTAGAAGLNVVGVSYRLSATERDTLYEANINPIASFPSEGLVVFGQKTLQITPSALDRINVRRLMIYVKREVTKISRNILFEQNIQSTWKKFENKTTQFLRGVAARGGITEYKVILDSTTTTPDLIDRNIMYAKVYIKPARAIEFIAIDFVITRSGAKLGT